MDINKKEGLRDSHGGLGIGHSAHHFIGFPMRDGAGQRGRAEEQLQLSASGAQHARGRHKCGAVPSQGEIGFRDGDRRLLRNGEVEKAE